MVNVTRLRKGDDDTRHSGFTEIPITLRDFSANGHFTDYNCWYAPLGHFNVDPFSGTSRAVYGCSKKHQR